MKQSSKTVDPSLNLRFGHEELVIRGRYETLSIVNDLLIGIIFLVGSFLFFSETTVTTGTWLFVVGSFLMLIRPSIRICRRFHLQKIQQNTADSGANSTDDSMDY